jgi:hypothetical protein
MTREITAAGITVQTLAETRQKMVDDLHASSEFGPEVPTGPETQEGQIIDVVATQLSELDELAQSLYDTRDPDNATGVPLDNVGAYSGAVRKDGTFSTVTMTLGGVASTVIAAGKRARVPDGSFFALDAEATIGGGGTVDADGTCTVEGPNEAAAGSITEIVDAVSGWNTVTNAADAELGTNDETDQEFRDRRERSFALGGNCTDPALRAKLEAIEGVTHATVISNRELTTDSDGIPGKSFRCVLWPTGLDGPTIAEVIYRSGPMGIRSDGDQEYTITDDQNYSQVHRFSYASEQLLYLHAEVTEKTGYPATGDDLVKAALLALGNMHRPGDDVEPDYFEGYVLYDSVNRVDGIAAITVTAKIGGVPGAGDTAPIPISLTQIARFDSTRITVTST